MNFSGMRNGVCFALTFAACFSSMPVGSCSADIFEWAWVDFLDLSKGKKQTSVLVPDGAGAVAQPDANFYQKNLTKAYLIGANLANATLSSAILSNADLSLANLKDANLSLTKLNNAALSSANLSDAYGRSAIFTNTSLLGADLSRADFESANFAGARMDSTTNFTGANLTGASFTGIAGVASILHGANFNGANLTGATFSGADITGADFSGSEIRNARFGSYFGTNLSVNQLYSTASYQSGDLTGVYFYNHDFAGLNLAGKDLTNSSFSLSEMSGANLRGANLTNARLGSDLTGAVLTDAIVTGAELGGMLPDQLYTTTSYRTRNLQGVGFVSKDLSGWNLSNQDLTGADFRSAKLGGTILAGAIIRDANFESIQDFTPAQLYSTASYQDHDLRGLTLTSTGYGFDFSSQDLSGARLTAYWGLSNLAGATIRDTYFRMYPSSILSGPQIYATASYQSGDMSGFALEAWAMNVVGWDLHGINLSNAMFLGHFEAGFLILQDFDFSGANLTDAAFNYAFVANSDFSGADMRGATIDFGSSLITQNTIRSNGTIQNLDLRGGQELVVRDYDHANSPIEILVEGSFEADDSSKLRFVFDADEWGSRISLEAGVPVILNGTLKLEFSENVGPLSQIGRTIKVFDWNGVAPTGTFDVSSDFIWDLSNLYSSGEITFLAVAGLAGDFNGDGQVDLGDYVTWRKGLGTTYSQAAYNVWRAHFGQATGVSAGFLSPDEVRTTVPEPATYLLVLAALFPSTCRRRA